MDRRKFLALPVAGLFAKPQSGLEPALIVRGDGGISARKLSDPEASLSFARDPDTGNWYAVNETGRSYRLI